MSGTNTYDTNTCEALNMDLLYVLTHLEYLMRLITLQVDMLVLQQSIVA